MCVCSLNGRRGGGKGKREYGVVEEGEGNTVDWLVVWFVGIGEGRDRQGCMKWVAEKGVKNIYMIKIEK